MQRWTLQGPSDAPCTCAQDAGALIAALQAHVEAAFATLGSSNSVSVRVKSVGDWWEVRLVSSSAIPLAALQTAVKITQWRILAALSLRPAGLIIGGRRCCNRSLVCCANPGRPGVQAVQDGGARGRARVGLPAALRARGRHHAGGAPVLAASHCLCNQATIGPGCLLVQD